MTIFLVDVIKVVEWPFRLLRVDNSERSSSKLFLGLRYVGYESNEPARQLFHSVYAVDLLSNGS